MNDTLKTIVSRKSVRQYKQERLSDEVLLELMKAGMAAPSAVDRRPWDFICITDMAILKKLALALPFAAMAPSAGAAIVVCGDTGRQYGGNGAKYWILDCCAATENMLIAAESMGLGAVWTAVYPEEDRIEKVRNILGIPGHIVPLNVIPVGVPSGREKAKNKFDPGRIHRDIW